MVLARQPEVAETLRRALAHRSANRRLRLGLENLLHHCADHFLQPIRVRKQMSPTAALAVLPSIMVMAAFLRGNPVEHHRPATTAHTTAGHAPIEQIPAIDVSLSPMALPGCNRWAQALCTMHIARTIPLGKLTSTAFE